MRWLRGVGYRNGKIPKVRRRGFETVCSMQLPEAELSPKY